MGAISKTKKGLYCRPEWKTDSDEVSCDRCDVEFSLIRRRHHCRGCGGLFCAECSSERRILPAFGYTRPQRVCPGCSGVATPVCTLQHSECQRRQQIIVNWMDAFTDIISKYTSKPLFMKAIGDSRNCEEMTHQEAHRSTVGTDSLVETESYGTSHFDDEVFEEDPISFTAGGVSHSLLLSQEGGNIKYTRESRDLGKKPPLPVTDIRFESCDNIIFINNSPIHLPDSGDTNALIDQISDLAGNAGNCSFARDLYID